MLYKLFKRTFVLITGGLAVASSLVFGTAFGADLKVLPGHVPAVVERLTPLGSLPSTNQMRLAIGVSLRDAAGLDQFLTQLYDPASTNYHKYLSPSEFTTRFGPTAEDYQAVADFARANGLTVVGSQSNRLVLDVIGPAASVETALHVRFHTYQHPTESRQFFAPDTEPSVDAILPVADIQGLSDYSKPHPLAIQGRGLNAPKYGGGTGFGGSYIGDDFRKAYAAGTTMTGAGQMVGLLQFDGYYASDIATYAQAAGGGRSSIVLQNVLIDGFSGQPTTGGDPEVSLDIEMAMAMAPGLSKIMVFEAGPNGYANDVLNSMVQNSAVKSFSSSWGWSGGPSATTDNIFKEMAAQGQSFFDASGDNCAFTAGANSANGVDNPSQDNAPSSSPYITVVGGTTLTMNSSSYGSETVWNWGGGEGSSGGISSYYTIPGWQTGISMASNQGSTTQRNIPDVALTADNVAAYFGEGQNGYFGGTSCAAPLWAGFMALVNQQAASQSNSSAGFINPAIYAICAGNNTNYSYAACFNDVTSGNNFSSASPNNFSAVPGYDLCTGLGTPNGTGLIAALAGGAGNVSVGSTNGSGGATNVVVLSANLSISPAAGFAFSGYYGGPFTPASAAFQLTNSTSTAGSWSLVSTSSWFKVLTTSGKLSGHSGLKISAELVSSADTLHPGSYSSSLIFSNLPAGTNEIIPVTLQISQALTESPAQGFNASGTAGGTIAGTQALVLTNLSGSMVQWSLTSTSAWLSATAKSGSIAAHGHATVTMSLSASAKLLVAGQYTASVSISDPAGLIAVVPFSLSLVPPVIQNGGFETGTFSGWTHSGNTAGTTVARANSAYVQSGTYGADLGPAGTPGYLSQTLATASGQTYLLSLWLRNSTGRTPNWFQIQWNGSAIFTETNFTDRNWTNFQFLVTATNSGTALELGFQGSLDEGLGLDNITVTPTANASVKLVARNSDDFHLVWNTAVGTTYQAQYKTNLCQSDWVNLGSPAQASADSLEIIDTNALQVSTQRFYRLLAIPPP